MGSRSVWPGNGGTGYPPAKGSTSLGRLNAAAASSLSARLLSQIQDPARAATAMTLTATRVAVGICRPTTVMNEVPNQPFCEPRMKATATTQSRVTGMRNFQPKRMNWS